MSARWTIDRDGHGALRLAVMVVLGFVLWHVAGQVITSGLFPRPVPVFHAARSIILSETFFSAVAVSTLRVVAAIASVFVIGSILTVLALHLDDADAFTFDLLFPVLYAFPAIIWIFIVVIVLGLSPFSPVVILALTIAPYYFIHVQEGFSNLDPRLIEVGEAFGTDRIAILRHAVLPQLYPHFLAALRSMVTSAYGVLILAELFAASNGIGARISQARSTYDIATITAWGIIVTVLLIGIDRVIRYIDVTYLRRHHRNG